MTAPTAPTVLRLAGGVELWQGPHGLSNATVLHDDASRAAVVVDALATPAMAAELRSALDRRALAVEALVLTHYHGDHVLGAAALAPAATYATPATAELLAERGERERAAVARLLPDAAEELGAATLPMPSPAGGELPLGAGGRELTLIALGHAHTPGDLVVLDRDSGVLVTGDVVVEGCLPVLRDAGTASWIAALGRLARLRPEVVVPGHGDVADAAALTRMGDLLAELRGAVAEPLRRGVESAALLAELRLPTWITSLDRQDRLPGIVARLEEELSAGTDAGPNEVEDLR